MRYFAHANVLSATAHKPRIHMYFVSHSHSLIHSHTHVHTHAHTLSSLAHCHVNLIRSDVWLICFCSLLTLHADALRRHKFHASHGLPLPGEKIRIQICKRVAFKPCLFTKTEKKDN